MTVSPADPAADSVCVYVPERATTGLAAQLVELTAAISHRLDLEPDVGLGGVHGYGVDFENDVFAMHKFCWCDKSDCPWCRGCDCIDPGESCVNCRASGDLPDGVSASTLLAPNFLYKITGTAVYWYKWIGRDMEVHGPELSVNWLATCIQSLPAEEADRMEGATPTLENQ